MRVRLLLLTLAATGCTTFSDIGRAFDIGSSPRDVCTDMAFEAEDLPPGIVAIPLPRHWIMYERRDVDANGAVLIKMAQRGFFGFNDATLSVTIAPGTPPTAMTPERAASFAPVGAMIGEVDIGDGQVRFRWVLHDASGWHNGLIAFTAIASKAGHIAVFSAAWPRDLEASQVLDDVNTIIDTVSHSCRK